MAFGLGLKLNLLTLRAACWHCHRHTRPVLAHACSLSPLCFAAPLWYHALLRGGLQHLVPVFQIGRSRQADALLLPVVQEILQSRSLMFRNPTNLPTHRCGAALDDILSTPTLPGCITVHSGSNCCSLAPLCCLLLSSGHMLCSCHLEPTQPTLPPCPECAIGQLWSPLVVTVSMCGTSLSWPTFHALFLTSLWTLSSAPSPKSYSTVHLFALVVAPSCPRRRTRQPIFDGTMRAATPLLLATAPGVTSVALDHLRTGSFPPLVPAVSQHSSFLQDPLLELVAWVCDVLSRLAPRLACSLIGSPSGLPQSHLTCAASRSAFPLHEARSQWRTHFSFSTGALFFSDDFFLSLSPLRVSYVLARVRQIRWSLLVQRTRCFALQSVTSLRQVRIAKLFSKFLSHGGVIFCSFSSTSSCAVVPSTWKSNLDGDPTSLDSYPISLASCAFKAFSST